MYDNIDEISSILIRNNSNTRNKAVEILAATSPGEKAVRVWKGQRASCSYTGGAAVRCGEQVVPCGQRRCQRALLPHTRTACAPYGAGKQPLRIGC